MTNIGLALSGIRHRRLRTFLSILSTAIAFAMVTISLSALHLLHKVVKESDQPVVVIEALVPPHELPRTALDRARKVPGAKAVEWSFFAAGSDKQNFFYPLWGVSPDFMNLYPPTLFNTPHEVYERWRADRMGILATADVMQRMRWKEGSLIMLETDEGPLEAHVIGLANSSLNDLVICHHEYFEPLAKGRNFISEIRIAWDKEHGTDIGSAVEAAFETSDPPVMVLSGGAVAMSFQANLATLPRLLTLIVIVVIALTIVITVTTLSMSLRERRREMGTLRALGFGRGSMIGLIMIETGTVCALGGAIGCGLPYLFLHREGIYLGRAALNAVTVPGLVCAEVILSALLLGVVIALGPALGVARQNIIQALDG